MQSGFLQFWIAFAEFVDDKIHITYHPSVSGRHDLTTGMSDKTLSVTDKQASQHRFLGSGIESLLRIASNYSNRFDEVVLSLPKGRKLQAITVSANRGQTNIRQANLENATIKIKGYLLRLTESSIKNSTLTAPHIINIFDAELTDSQVKTEGGHLHVEDIQIHGKVELEARSDLNLILTKEERQRINLNLAAKHGSIIHFKREGRHSVKKGENNQYERLTNPYKTEKAEVKNQLIARADGDIFLLKDED